MTSRACMPCCLRIGVDYKNSEGEACSVAATVSRSKGFLPAQKTLQLMGDDDDEEEEEEEQRGDEDITNFIASSPACRITTSKVVNKKRLTGWALIAGRRIKRVCGKGLLVQQVYAQWRHPTTPLTLHWHIRNSKTLSTQSMGALLALAINRFEFAGAFFRSPAISRYPKAAV